MRPSLKQVFAHRCLLEPPTVVIALALISLASAARVTQTYLLQEKKTAPKSNNARVTRFFDAPLIFELQKMARSVPLTLRYWPSTLFTDIPDRSRAGSIHPITEWSATRDADLVENFC